MATLIIPGRKDADLESKPFFQEKSYWDTRILHGVDMKTARAAGGQERLEKAIEEASDPETRRELELALAWSKRVNWAIEEIVTGMPPFPYVRESLEKIAAKADAVVVSSTPGESPP